MLGARDDRVHQLCVAPRIRLSFEAFDQRLQPRRAFQGPVDRVDVEGDGFDRKDIGGLVNLEHEVLDLPEQCIGKGQGLDRLLVGVEEAPQHGLVGGEARAQDRQVALLGRQDDEQAVHPARVEIGFVAALLGDLGRIAGRVDVEVGERRRREAERRQRAVVAVAKMRLLDALQPAEEEPLLNELLHRPPPSPS